MSRARLTPTTLNTLGVLTVVFGLCAICLAVGSLGMLAFQRTVLAWQPESAGAEQNARFYEIMTDGWSVYMPAGALLGLAFALAGRWLMRLERRGRPVAWASVFGTVAWFVGYVRFCATHWDELTGGFVEPFGERMLSILFAFSVSSMALVLFAYPAFLLYVLRRPFPEAGAGS